MFNRGSARRRDAGEIRIYLPSQRAQVPCVKARRVAIPLSGQTIISFPSTVCSSYLLLKKLSFLHHLLSSSQPCFPFFTPLTYFLILHPSATLCCHFFITRFNGSLSKIKVACFSQTPYFWTSTRWPASELDYGKRCKKA